MTEPVPPWLVVAAQHKGNGVPIAGFDDLHRCLTAEQVRRQGALTVLRRASKLVLTVVPRESR